MMKTKALAKQVVSVALIAVLSMLMLCACSGGSKTAVTAQEFSAKAESLGFKTADTSDTYSEYDYVVSRTTAYEKSDDKIAWQMDFLVADSADKAAGMFNGNKETFDELSGSVLTISVGNYSTYEKTGEGKFMYLCRVDKTMLYVNVDEQYKDSAKKLISALGY